MSLTLRIFLSLVAGLAVGSLLAAYGSPEAAEVFAAVADPIGGVWLDALQATVIPLVIGLLFTGIADAAGSARASRLAGRALLLFGVLIVTGGVIAVTFVPALLGVWPIAADAARALIRDDAVIPAAATLSAGAWLRSFVPTNVFAALAGGSMLQLVIFTGAFAMAATRLPVDARQRLIGFFEAVTQAMLVLVHWVLMLAPIGVFALASQVGIKVGIGAIGILTHYVAIVIAVQIVVIVLIYVLVALMARQGVLAFARAAVPAQVVAVSTQSSIATLPAMLEATTRGLGVPDNVARLVLPMAVSIFRMTSAPANLAVVLYVANLHGIVLGPAELAVGVAVAFAASIAAVGLPGQVSFITSVAPIALAMGVPITTLPLLIAVEMLPDIFRTLGNVTGDMGVTVILARDAVAEDAPLEDVPLDSGA
ncbi:sodium:dicarboxylate symporter [Polymorphobacter glacialis]|uniref:Sodium:dicarboxylate symporter n=1 Tax=Sandarakinorhabdus glacialis TaxID=1614636 RepID=A0A916ZJJ5_9SPHN|nr:cation:dicarboxylase symporter family transporter [Polymorphobacter glacialis]GGE01055.1 sodium:dicarboxylate symporter [Polymorphobacter glacialis]